MRRTHHNAVATSPHWPAVHYVLTFRNARVTPSREA